MPSEYVVVTREEFEAFLPDGFTLVDNSDAQELIYDIPTSDDRIFLRIYSSVDTRSLQTRAIGADAIRCILFDVNSGKPIGKGKRTHRMTNWKDRLQEKIDQLMAEVSELKFCKTCGSVMKLRTGKFGAFYSCIRYPLCTTKMGMDGVYREGIHSDGSSNGSNGGPRRVVKCPRCDSPMRPINGRNGKFWGCTNYPGCRGTRQDRDVENGIGVEEVRPEPEPVQQTIAPIVEQAKPQPPVDIPTDDSDIELVPTANYPHLEYKFEKFNPVQSRVFQYYSEDINCVVAAATSAGKTAIAEMFMADSIAKGKKAVFLSPLKAVSQEKHDDWTDDSHDWSKLNVSIVTGDYALTPKRVEELNAANVIIMTTEMMDSRTRRIHTERNDWLLNVGTVVMDESHLLCMEGRGDRAESAIMRFTQQNPDCRIVFLSATMPNVSELARWLTSLNGKRTELINSSYRPCQLDVHYVRYADYGRYAENEENKIRTAIELTQEHKNDKFILFVHAKSTGRRLESILKNMGEIVQFHNADLVLKDRIRISEQFKQKGGLRIIIATSTLAWGINLPARRVVVIGVHRGLSEVEPLDIKQEVGRAGRVGFDPKGDSYILLPESKFNFYKEWCENIPPITSTMNKPDVLAFHIISEVEQRKVYDVKTLMDWYNRSLAAFQSDYLDRVDAEDLLQKLAKLKVIEEKNGRYSITSLGRVAAYLYYSPYSISGWFFNFSRIIMEDKINNITLSWALANIPEYAQMFAPKDLSQEVESFRRRCMDYGLQIGNGPAVMGLYYHACLDYNPDVGDIQKRAVKYDIERIISALIMIDNRCTSWHREDYWKKLELRINYEVSEDQVELVSLKGIGGTYARKLFSAGIRRISDFTRNKDRIVKLLGKKFYDKIVAANNL